MKQLTLIIILALVSCKNPATEEQITKNHEWIRANSQHTIEYAEARIELSETKEKDLKVIEQLKTFERTTDGLLDDLENDNREQILTRMKQHLDTLMPANMVMSNPYEDFLSLDKNSSLNEFRTSIALWEDHTFGVYSAQIGNQDMIFDTKDLYFIPDTSGEQKEGKVSGKLLYAITNSNVDRLVKMYVNEEEIPITNGYGIVNIAKNDLSRTGGFTAKLVINFSGLELTKEFEIENR